MSIRTLAFLAGALTISPVAGALAADAPGGDLLCNVTETRPFAFAQQSVTTLHVPLVSGREQEATAGVGRYSLLRVVTEEEVTMTANFGEYRSTAHIDRMSGRFDLTNYKNGETIYHAEGTCHPAAKQF
ncbi:MAG: hypothetical protein ACLQJR_32355 [Stellaceae bacterium]